jgi:hypothetical protein
VKRRILPQRVRVGTTPGRVHPRKSEPKFWCVHQDTVVERPDELADRRCIIQRSTGTAYTATVTMASLTAVFAATRSAGTTPARSSRSCFGVADTDADTRISRMVKHGSPRQIFETVTPTGARL